MGKLFVILALAAALQLSSARSVDKDPFIVGGEPAEIADFPHQLALIDMVAGTLSGYMCGASNIHRLWALTAAHCVDFGTHPSLMSLWGGSTSRTSGGHIFFISAYTLHPGYNRNTFDLDIAVIQVQPGTPLEGFAHVTPIPIPSICTAACCGVCPGGSEISVSGWGAIETGALPDLLRQVSKPIMDQALCVESWRVWPQILISSSSFCTIIENGRDSCHGDSGSPIVRDGVQVGVVAFGDPVCGAGNLPAVYVRIEDATVRNFIAGFVDV